MYKIIKGLSKTKLIIHLRWAFGPKGEGLVEGLWCKLPIGMGSGLIYILFLTNSPQINQSLSN